MIGARRASVLWCRDELGVAENRKVAAGGCCGGLCVDNGCFCVLACKTSGDM